MTSDETTINGSVLRIQKCDITDLEVESFVFYAREDLKLGSGYGTAVSVRGGPSVQESLNKLAPVTTCEAVITEAGEMKAQYIVHAVGPKFREPETSDKLIKTIQNALKTAEEKGISEIAFPAMGAGFYGVPLAESAEITLGTIRDYLNNGTKIKNVVVCLMDNREYRQFKSEFTSLIQTRREPS
jgi:O-acetyl-ADP-ribose deacetylase (regulator of RNase III)